MEVESPERGKIGGIAMEIPATDGATLLSPPRIPPRILQKLSEPKPKTPSTAEEIEAKLRGADLRRQVLLTFSDKLYTVDNHYFPSIFRSYTELVN